jgi:mRNA interferase YafQ
LRSVRYSTRFSKDVKREGKSPENRDALTKLQVIIDLLAEDKELPANLHDHQLVGDLVGMRELHVKPDLLLVYRKIEDVSIELLRLGSHSEIFG